MFVEGGFMGFRVYGKVGVLLKIVFWKLDIRRGVFEVVIILRVVGKFFSFFYDVV